jgi:hypothetical protein
LILILGFDDSYHQKTTKNNNKTGSVVSILVDENLIGTLLATIVDAVVNKLMIQVCFVDLIFSGLVKMRLFNG